MLVDQSGNEPLLSSRYVSEECSFFFCIESDLVPLMDRRVILFRLFFFSAPDRWGRFV